MFTFKFQAQVDRQRRVKPGANQAMVPLPINPLQRRDENVAVAVRNITRKPTESKKSTQVLAVVQRPHDQIILTQDDKGKQMVVQRGHNVAKIQRRQRNVSDTLITTHYYCQAPAYKEQCMREI